MTTTTTSTLAPVPGGAPARPRRSRHRATRVAVRAVQYVLLLGVALISAFPLLWALINSVRPNSEIVAYPPKLLPREFTFEHVEALFTLYDFHPYLWNSLVVSTGATLGAIVLGTTAAYAMTRFDLPAVRAMSVLSLLAYLVPAILVLIPITQFLFSNGWGDNRIALTVLYAGIFLPFTIWLLRSYFQGVGVEVEEAAMIDGCSRIGAFLRVVIPQAIPGIVSTGIFTFNATWSEYLFVSSLMTTNSKLTANPAVFLLMGHMGTTSWGLLMSAAVIIVLPVLVLFFVAQRWVVSGISDGSVKG
jgi:ABC-type glycerol-3-phosphate transport system permease component